MTYKITLLPTDKERIAESRLAVLKQTSMFVAEMVRGHQWAVSTSEQFRSNPSMHVIDEKAMALIEDLTSGRYWGVLTYVDGRTPDSKFEGPEAAEQYSNEAREWAKHKFTRSDLGKLLNIVVNQAMLQPFLEEKPGSRRGHCLLYEELVLKKGSMFAKAVTPEFRKTLENGRFWEDLGCMGWGSGYGHVSGALEDSYADLDTDFAPFGLELMCQQWTNGDVQDLDVRSLSGARIKDLTDQAILRYARFVGELDGTDAVAQEIVEMMLVPYVEAALKWDFNWNMPLIRGPPGEDERSEYDITFKQMLGAGVVQKYLGTSEALQQTVGKTLVDTEKHIDEYWTFPGFVKDVIECMPDKQAIVRTMRDQYVTPGWFRLHERCEENGVTLDNYL